MSDWNISPEENQRFQEIAGTLGQEIQHDRRVHAIAFNAITRISSGTDNSWVRLQARDAMARAVLEDLAAYGYAITYVGGAK
ncbi:hypothetical protein [Nonomuraea sp. NPDC049750]|uniref:hypothetical protein n=1 Tax=Nonomuraea sp. NPDC049750 TaxID=3154738 RepID=UPI0033EBD1EC